MPMARQLCRASNTVMGTDSPLRKCPHCGAKLQAVEHLRWIEQGMVELRPVVPPHPRDERGEVQARLNAEKTKYPGVV